MTKSVRQGFTLIELMIVVAILGILAAIAIPYYGQLVIKSKEGKSRGNLGEIRSALSIYFSDNEGIFPSDDLQSLAVSQHYIDAIPVLLTPDFHLPTAVVLTEVAPTDSGQWSYNNQGLLDPQWGKVFVGCSHSDSRGLSWSTY